MINNNKNNNMMDGDIGGAIKESGDKESLTKLAEEYKADGNRHFQQHRFQDALQAYSRAITACEATSNDDDNAGEQEGGGTTTPPLLAVCLSNRAFCHLKLESYGLAIRDAEAAIALCPTFAKAFYRRGCAYVALTRISEALKNFQSAHALQPSNDTLSKIKDCQKELRQQRFAEAIRSERSQSVSETVDLKKLEVGLEGYTGPRYKREPAFLKQLLEFIKEPGNVLHKHDAYQMVLDVLELLKKAPTLVEIEVKNDETFTVCGDVHGQFYDLLNIFKINGLPDPEHPYLFNGDFVDRGSFSVECMMALFAAKLIYPNHVHLARGNHETRCMNALYGFKGEIVDKYDEAFYELCSECFCWLPLAHLINKKVLVVHGGLFAKDNVTLADIAKIQRNMQPPDEGLMTELLWSDPQPQQGRSPSKRGVACAFGPDVTANFLETNNLSYVIRSHEMKPMGYDVEHGGNIITVFSAPNYCDQMGNKGALIRMKGCDIGKGLPEFVTFDAVEHPQIPSMKYANSLFSLL